jgi:ferredoxin
MCATVCPHGVFSIEARMARIIDRDACMECGACARNCPAEAITVEAGVGCVVAIIKGALAGAKPNCECNGSYSCDETDGVSV